MLIFLKRKKNKKKKEVKNFLNGLMRHGIKV